MRRRALLALAVSLLLLPPSAGAGGSFERIVGVGARGAWSSITLAAGPGSDAALAGLSVPAPRGGYIRVYPFVGGLPAVPGRYYPAPHVLCLYWREPVSHCSLLGPAGRALLSRFDRLPLRRLSPTAPVGVWHHSRLVRYANGNIFAALELALERPVSARRLAPRDAIALTVSWRGPRARAMPVQLWLAPVGVYASHRAFPLPHGPWCYLAENLHNSPAALIAAVSSICR
jgi:hypothetical protein